jgi:hypothetical protein
MAGETLTDPADLREACAELAELCPVLPAALARDTGIDGGLPAAWGAVAVVNADVLAAIIMVEEDVPAAVRGACYAISEPWRHRDLQGCLRQIPRLASRMHDLGLAPDEKAIAWQAGGWLRVVKRALGLRRPDIDIGYDCPHAETCPEVHHDGCALLAAGDEGFLRHAPDGLRVEWVHTPRIYCQGCDASWTLEQWPHLGRLLAAALWPGGWPTPRPSPPSPAASPPPSGRGRTATRTGCPAAAPAGPAAVAGPAPCTTSRKPSNSPCPWPRWKTPPPCATLKRQR